MMQRASYAKKGQKLPPTHLLATPKRLLFLSFDRIMEERLVLAGRKADGRKLSRASNISVSHSGARDTGILVFLC